MANVLVVDDDDGLRDVLARCLAGAGHAVETAGSAATAMDVLDRGDTQVVLADVIMPGGTGIHLLRALRNRTPRIPVSAQTASTGLCMDDLSCPKVLLSG